MDKDKKKKNMAGYDICHFPGCNEQLPPGRRKYCCDRHLNFAHAKNYIDKQ